MTSLIQGRELIVKFTIADPELDDLLEVLDENGGQVLSMSPLSLELNLDIEEEENDGG